MPAEGEVISEIDQWFQPYTAQGVRPPGADQVGATAFRVHECGCQVQGDDWRHRGVCSPFWRLYHNFRAGGEFAAGGRCYALRPQTAALVPAGVRFDCRGKPGVPHLWIHFTPEWGLARPRGEPLLVAADPALAAVLARLRKLLTAKPTEVPAIHHVSLAVLHLAFAKVTADPGQEPSPRLRAVLGRIRHGLAGELTNRALAAQAGLSVEGFNRWFRAELDCTPAEYVRQQRVGEACRLLAYTERSIEDIAEAVGFKNRHHFSRVFQRKMGSGPATFRRGSGRA